jgi:hypothetical protein
LQKPIRKRYSRNPYTVTNIDDVWEMDLADLISLSKYNNKQKCLLKVIDLFSRYAWNVALRDKTATWVTTGLKTLFQNTKQIIIKPD